ncbi:MAG: serine/threonine protein kinase [Armatimonadetes bacterium]|nr:serine/threonine protein kinase [Armatimonadota bacterium]
MEIAAVVLVVAAVAFWLLKPKKVTVGGDPLLGRTLGKYRLVQRLGAGGMASVYRATPTGGGLPVAVKVMRPEMSAAPVLRERFEREARVGSELRHPGIVRVLEWGEDGGALYLAMDLIPGNTLRQRLNGGALPLDEAVGILIALMEAMSHAHQNGCLHRDLKPGNVMITPGQSVRILDFGLVTRHDFVTLTRTGQVMGTVGYGAPEQLAGKSGDARSDQYALGVIGYEMLTGKQPFKGNVRGLLDAAAEPDPITALRAEVPAAVADVVKRMMARDPGRRFGDLGEALSELRAAR